jgi:hypothetical protein
MSLSDPNNQKGLFLVCHTPAHLTPLPRLVHLPLSGWAIDVCVCVCVCAKDMTQHKQSFCLSSTVTTVHAAYRSCLHPSRRTSTLPHSVASGRTPSSSPHRACWSSLLLCVLHLSLQSKTARCAFLS